MVNYEVLDKLLGPEGFKVWMDVWMYVGMGVGVYGGGARGDERRFLSRPLGTFCWPRHVSDGQALAVPRDNFVPNWLLCAL